MLGIFKTNTFHCSELLTMPQKLTRYKVKTVVMKAMLRVWPQLQRINF